MWKTLSVLAILLAGAGATFRYMNTDAAKLESELLERSKTNLAFVEERMDEMDSEITTFTGKATDTNGEAEEKGQQLETAKGQLTDLNTNKSNLEEQIAEKKAKLDALKEQLAEFGNIEELSEKVDGLQLEMATVQTDLLSAKERIKSLIATKASTEKRIASYKEKEEMVTAGKMTFLSARVSQSFGDWGFVVIDAGANQGVNARTMLEVVRGSDVVGKLLVSNLESNIAVCDILSVADGASITPGSRVRVAAESKWDPDRDSVTAAAPATPAGGAGAAEPAPAPAPAPEEAGDPFGLDGGSDPDPGTAEEDPFGLGGDDPAPADDDPFGLN